MEILKYAKNKTHEKEKMMNEASGMGHNNPPTDEQIMSEKYKKIFDELKQIASEANLATDSLSVRDGEKTSIKTDADVNKFGPIAKNARAIFAKIDKIRKEEKQFYLDKGKEIDNFFNQYKGRAEYIYKTIEESTSEFQTRKIQAERAAARAEAERHEKEALRLRQEAEKAKRTETAYSKLAAAESAELRADAALEDANASNAKLGAVIGDNGSVMASARTVWDFTIVDYDKIPLDKLRVFFSRADIEKAIKKFASYHKEASSLEGVKFTEKAKTRFR